MRFIDLNIKYGPDGGENAFVCRKLFSHSPFVSGYDRVRAQFYLAPAVRPYHWCCEKAIRLCRPSAGFQCLEEQSHWQYASAQLVVSSFGAWGGWNWMGEGRGLGLDQWRPPWLDANLWIGLHSTTQRPSNLHKQNRQVCALTQVKGTDVPFPWMASCGYHGTCRMQWWLFGNLGSPDKR